MIVYLKQDLFEAPKGSLLAHSCNCQGVWGSGVALAFKRTCPEGHNEYSAYCAENNKWGRSLLGKFFVATPPNDPYKVGCLFVSEFYGHDKDDIESILSATNSSFRYLMQYCGYVGINTVWIPKINSGLFGVPWERTEKVINDVLKDFSNITINVCTPE